MDPVAPWWLAVSSIAGAIIIKVADFFLGWKSDRASENAQAALIQGLTDRIVGLEARLTTVEARLAEEIGLKLKAQEEMIGLRANVSRLVSHLSDLEELLRKHGVEPPPFESPMVIANT